MSDNTLQVPGSSGAPRPSSRSASPERTSDERIKSIEVQVRLIAEMLGQLQKDTTTNAKTIKDVENWCVGIDVSCDSIKKHLGINEDPKKKQEEEYQEFVQQYEEANGPPKEAPSSSKGKTRFIAPTPFARGGLAKLSEEEEEDIKPKSSASATRSPFTPRAPSATAETKKSLKVKAPEPLKSTNWKEAKAWLLKVINWAEMSKDQFEDEYQLVRYTLNLMEGEAAAWATVHLSEWLKEKDPSKRTIHDMSSFLEEFEKSFGDPDLKRASHRQIRELTQESTEHGTTVEYTTKFQTIAYELDWPDEPLMAQYMEGLHWKVKEVLSQRETEPSTLKELQNAAIKIDNIRRENEEQRERKKGKKEDKKDKGKGKASNSNTKDAKEKNADKPNYVPKEEQDQRKEWGLCVKCGRGPHDMKECKTGWDATPAKDPKNKKEQPKKETAKVAKDESKESEEEDAESGKE